ncbi:hypothetical protein E2C01_042911 [Portunus trituberculatus]|uniref:Uncharacterized protein n=1 Tax=Portunus trituberculatus TaxID=210409 RepID=A0A5B7FUN6_PORTR|nr:hypothetical protein [Portunus trituberculatus]
MLASPTPRNVRLGRRGEGQAPGVRGRERQAQGEGSEVSDLLPPLSSPPLASLSVSPPPTPLSLTHAHRQPCLSACLPYPYLPHLTCLACLLPPAGLPVSYLLSGVKYGEAEADR